MEKVHKTLNGERNMQQIKILHHLNLKQKLLVGNILSIIFAVTAIYGLLEFVLVYNIDFFKFTASSDFITLIILAIFCYIGWKMIKNSMTKSEKQQLKRPKLKHKNQSRKTQKPKYHKPTGTWTCPRCNHLTSGEYCKTCNYRRI